MLEYQYSKIGSYICHVAKEPPTSLNELFAWGRLVVRNEKALAIRGLRRRMGFWRRNPETKGSSIRVNK